MEWRSVVKLKDPQAISQVEDQLGVRFPAGFADLVKRFNHGTASPDTFDTGTRKGKAFGRLLNFNLDSKNNILHEYQLIQDHLPAKVIPFAGDAGGNYLCFDYRDDKQAPVIVFFDHEAEDELKIELVAADLEALFAKLYAERDEAFEKWQKREVIWENFIDEEKLRGLSQPHLDAVNERRRQKGLLPIEKQDAN